MDDEAARLRSSFPNEAIHCLALRQHPREWITWLGAAARAAHQLGECRRESAHLGNLGKAYSQLGDWSKARELWEKALAVFDAIDDPHGRQVRQALAGLG